MKMRHTKRLVFLILLVLALLAFLFPTRLIAQQDPQKKEQSEKQNKEQNKSEVTDHGVIEFGVRLATGDVYGRPDLRTGQCLGCGTPFDPALSTSKFNEYGDVRDGFYVPHLDVHYDNILGSKNYVSLQSQKVVYRDQSYLATFGEHGKLKVQFRYDEIPHIYSNTTRTVFTQTSPGVWSFPAAIRGELQATPAANLPSLMAGTGSFVGQGVVTNFSFITPSISRKAGTVLLSYDRSAKWNLNASYFRESQKGLRPIGLIMNSSPSASATSGFGLELPEPLNYFNNLVSVGSDYGTRAWSVQAFYLGSFFDNNIRQLTWDNPFVLSGETATTPLTGRMALYPDNQANYLNFAGAADIAKYFRFMASIVPGWLRQDSAFLPYSTNTAINTCGNGSQACTSLGALPASSLGGSKHTLAMNYTLVTTAWKNIELKTTYRQYDYNNDTPVRTFTPVEGDVNSPGSVENTPFGFNRKNLEASGTWFFAKKSSVKAGYLADWMDRSHRDVAHSLENTFFTAVDWTPIRDLLFRVSYGHSARNPDAYQDPNSTDPTTGAPVPCSDTTNVSFTADQRCLRRFDESARLRNRADGLVEYSPTDKITLSAFAGTLQDNYNRAGGTNSPAPLNFLSGSAATVGPYFLYGVLKDLSWNYGFDVDYSLSSQVTFFAEYSHERYHKRMISRYRTPPGSGQNILTCSGCDTANNDWESVAREPVNIYTIGTDTEFAKKFYFSTYYSLSAGVGNVFSRPLGDPTITSGTNQFLLTGTNAAVDYPETVNRNHEFVAVFKYKLTERFSPKLEYRYQQWDYKDYQTSPMTQYMGCVSPIPNGPPVTNAVPGCTTPLLLTNTPNPGSSPSPFYPGFVVGDTSAARYLFLGVDQPSYHAHTIIATLEYRF